MTKRDPFYFLMGYFLLCWPFVVHNYDIPIVVFCLAGVFLGGVVKKKNITVAPLYKVLLILLACLLFWMHFDSLRGVRPGVALLSMMAGVKALEMKTMRDYGIFLLIVQLMMTGNFLILESLLYLVLIVLSTVVFFYLLLMVHCDGEVTRKRDVQTVFAKTFLLAVALGVALFFIFPRFNFSLFNIRSVVENPMTGFAKELVVGEIAKIYDNDENVFRVSFKGESPPLEELYWRGEVLDFTDGMNWKRKGPGKKRQHDLAEETLYTYTVFFEDYGTGHLFNLKNVKSMQGISGFHSVETAPGIYEAFPFSTRPFSYESQTASIKKIDPLVRVKKYLQLAQTPSASIVKLVEEPAKLGSLPEKIQWMEEFFREGDFVYTFEPGTYGKGRFMEEFLLERKRGFCGHFASASAMLFRLLGVAARVVVGFQGGVLNPYLDQFSVRGTNSHAWVEYWDEKAGWMRFDPTMLVAPERITDSQDFLDAILEGQGKGGFRKILRDIRFQVESLYYMINVSFLNYDVDAQRDFLGNLFNMTVERKGLFAALGLVLVCFLLLQKLTLRWRNRVSDTHKRSYMEMLKKLQKKGIPVSVSNDASEVLAQTAPSLKDLQREALHGFLSLYTEIRYGKAPPKTALLKQRLKRFLSSL